MGLPAGALKSFQILLYQTWSLRNSCVNVFLLRLKVWTELFYEGDTEKSWEGSCTLKTKTCNQVVYIALVWDQADYNSVFIGKWKKEKCRDLVCPERMNRKHLLFTPRPTFPYLNSRGVSKTRGRSWAGLAVCLLFKECWFSLTT